MTLIMLVIIPFNGSASIGTPRAQRNRLTSLLYPKTNAITVIEQMKRITCTHERRNTKLKKYQNIYNANVSVFCTYPKNLGRNNRIFIRKSIQPSFFWLNYPMIRRQFFGNTGKINKILKLYKSNNSILHGKWRAKI